MIKDWCATVAFAAGVAVIAGAGAASTVSLQYEGPVSEFRTVRITDSPVAPPWDDRLPSEVIAGGFNITDRSGTLADFIAWCLDLGAPLGVGGGYEYVVTDTPFSNSFLSTDGQARVQRYFDANYTLDLASDANQSAAFQLGLWNSVYDTDATLSRNNRRSDEFAARGASNGNGATNRAITALANGYLSAAESFVGPSVWMLTFFESTDDPRQQNIVSAQWRAEPAQIVPVPPAGLMLGGAMIGLGWLRRRSKVHS